MLRSAFQSGVMTPMDRLRARKALASIPNEFATRLYQSFFALYQAEDASTLRSLARDHGSNFEGCTDVQIPQFLRCCADVGPLVDMLSDCASLSPSSRMRKWTADEQAMHARRTLQLQTKEAQERSSMRALRDRQTNKLAFDMIRFACEKARSGTLSKDGLECVVFTDDELKMLPRTFWYEIPLRKMTDVQLRATLHRIECIKGAFGRSHFPPDFGDLVLSPYVCKWTDVLSLLTQHGLRYRRVYRWRRTRRWYLDGPFNRLHGRSRTPATDCL